MFQAAELHLHCGEVTVANSLKETLELRRTVRIVCSNAFPVGVGRCITDEVQMLFTEHTLNLVVEGGVVNAYGASDDGVSGNGEFLALSIFAENAFVGVSLNLGEGKDLNAFLLELAQLRVLVDDADFSASLLGGLDNRNLTTSVHGGSNLDASEAAADNGKALLNQQVRTEAPLHKAKRCAQDAHAEAGEAPHSAHARGVLALYELLQCVGVDNVLAVLAGNVGGRGFRANSEDYLVSAEVLDVLGISLGVQANVETKTLDLVVIPINHRRKLFVQNLSEVQEAASLLLLVNNGNVLEAAHLEVASSFQAGGTSTNDEDLLLCLCAGYLVVFGLAELREVYVGVNGALAGLADEDVVQAARANDAGANFLGATLGNLDADFGLCDPVTSHTSCVAGAVGEDLLAYVEVVDTGAREARQRSVLLSFLGQVDELAFRNQLVCNGARSLMEASLDGPSVDAVSLYNLDDLLEVFNALAARHKVVCRVANEDRVVFAALLVDLVNDVGEKLAATLGVSAVLVGTVVGVLGDEAHNHVADACMDLDDVDASLLAALSSFAVLLDYDLKFFLGEFLFRHANEGARCNVDGRSIGVKFVFTRCTPLVAELQLSSELCAVLVANLCGAGKAGDEAVVPNAYSAGGGVILGVGVEYVANIAGAELDQSGTALCALLVKVYEVIANMVVVGLFDGHRQHDEAVSQLHVADLKRLVQ